jgi:3-hydroxyacyl-[acyl-carrier-protein] dehydratase
VKSDIRDSLLSVSPVEADGEIVAEYSFAGELDVFAGHFPGNPVLPGVFQIEMIRHALETLYREKYIIKLTSKAKFSSMIFPDSTITLRIKQTDIDGGIKVRAKSYVDQKMTSDVIMVLNCTDQNTIKP